MLGLFGLSTGEGQNLIHHIASGGKTGTRTGTIAQEKGGSGLDHLATRPVRTTYVVLVINSARVYRGQQYSSVVSLECLCREVERQNNSNAINTNLETFPITVILRLVCAWDLRPTHGSPELHLPWKETRRNHQSAMLLQYLPAQRWCFAARD